MGNYVHEWGYFRVRNDRTLPGSVDVIFCAG